MNSYSGELKTYSHPVVIRRIEQLDDYIREIKGERLSKLTYQNVAYNIELVADMIRFRRADKVTFALAIKDFFTRLLSVENHAFRSRSRQLERRAARIPTGHNYLPDLIAARRNAKRRSQHDAATHSMSPASAEPRQHSRSVDTGAATPIPRSKATK